MRRHSLSLLIILPFIIILFLPSLVWSSIFTAIKTEIRQNPDNTYSLYTIIKADKPTSIKLTIRIVKSDSAVVIIPITTTKDGTYTFWYDNILLIKNFVIPNSKDIFPYIKDASLVYAESGTDNWQELANGSGKILFYKDKEGKDNPFVILPNSISLYIRKINGKITKGNKVSLSLKNGNKINLELEIYSADYKTPFEAIIYEVSADLKSKIKEVLIIGVIQKEELEYTWNNEKRMELKIAIKGSSLTRTAFVNISNKESLSNIIWSGFKKIWWIMLIALLIGIFVSKLSRIRSNRPKPRLGIYNKDRQNELKQQKEQASEPSRQKDRKKQKESLKVNKELWFSKLWQRKPIVALNVSFEFSEENKQFMQNIPNAKDFNGKPEWLIIKRNQSVSYVYIFELNPYFNAERKSGIITFYDKKGRIICPVGVSYKAQVTAKNADISNVVKKITEMSEVLKNLPIPTDVKDKKAEEKVDTGKENVLSDIDKKVEVLQFRLLITREGKAGKQTLEIPEMIYRWTGKPDWIRIDEINKRDKKYSFEAITLTNKPETNILGYNSKRQLVAIVLIIPDKSGKKEQISQEYYPIDNTSVLKNDNVVITPDESAVKEQSPQESYQIDSTSVLKNDGDSIVIVLKRDNNYTEKIRIISEIKPVLKKESPVNGDIYPGGIDGEWTISLSIDSHNRVNLIAKELKIDVMYTVQNGQPYVICKPPAEQPSLDTPNQPINITLESNGQLKADKSDNPQKITVPKSDNLGAKLINNLYKVLSNPGIDVNEQDKREKRELLADLIENPDNTKTLIKLLGLPEKKSITVDTKTSDQVVNKGVPITTSNQEKSIDRKNLITDVENKMIQDATDKINKMLKEAEEKADIILQNAREEAKKISQDAQTGIEIEETIIEVKEDKHIQALINLINAIEKASYEGKESDINLLNELIGNIKVINETIGDIEKFIAVDFDSPILKKLMDWGANFYKRKQSNPQKLDDIWQIYTQIMNDPFNIFVIWKANTSFNSNDHVVDGSSFILDYNVTVTKVINPGFKVSARVRDQQGKIIKKASVQISDTQQE